MELLRLHHVEAGGPNSQLVCCDSAPVGLMNLSLSDIKRDCEKYIEKMIANPQYALQTTDEDMRSSAYLVLEAVRKYSAQNKVRLPN